MRFILSVSLLFPLTSFAAHLLSITATSPFPASVTAGKSATAIFTVTNNSPRINITAVDKSVFPKNSGLSVSSSTCGGVMSPGSSCTVTLQLLAPATAQTISTALQMWAKPSLDGVQYPFSVIIDPAPTNHYAYISNSSDNTVSYCLINSGGSLSSCATTGSNFGTPNGIAINPAGTMAYIADHTTPGIKAASKRPADGSVTYCRINTDGSLSSCAVTTNGSSGNPIGIAINPAGTYAYTTNQLVGVDGSPAKPVSYCQINSDGSFGSCNLTGTGITGTATGIAINPKGTYAYVTAVDQNTTYRCPINSDGSLDTCSSTGSGLFEPYGITVNSAGTFAYMADGDCYSASYCSINQTDGSFETCHNTIFSFALGCLAKTLEAAGVTIFSNTNIAYFVLNSNTTATYCNVNSDGSLSSCHSTGGPFNTPVGIAVN